MNKPTPDDQNLRELHFANQKEETPRVPTSETQLSEEESAAIAARTGKVLPPNHSQR